MKPCRKCGETKPLDGFAILRSAPDGRQYTCRECRAAYGRANRDKETARYAAWVANNREHHAAYMDTWRSANRDKMRQYNAAWAASNQDIRRENRRRRRAREREATVERFSFADLLASWQERGLSGCTYCPDGEFEHVDHVIPLARGGAHIVLNLVPSCAWCNKSKGASLLEEWLPKHEDRLASA